MALKKALFYTGFVVSSVAMGALIVHFLSAVFKIG